MFLGNFRLCDGKGHRDRALPAGLVDETLRLGRVKGHAHHAVRDDGALRVRFEVEIRVARHSLDLALDQRQIDFPLLRLLRLICQGRKIKAGKPFAHKRAEVFLVYDDARHTQVDHQVLAADLVVRLFQLVRGRAGDLMDARGKGRLVERGRKLRLVP